MECLLSTLIDRLKDVTCAADSNEHDMNKLKITVAKAASYRASPDIVDGANQLYKRLHTELGKYYILHVHHRHSVFFFYSMF